MVTMWSPSSGNSPEVRISLPARIRFSCSITESVARLSVVFQERSMYFSSSRPELRSTIQMSAL